MFKKAAKKCLSCGKSTVKPDRVECKKCGSSKWAYVGKHADKTIGKHVDTFD